MGGSKHLRRMEPLEELSHALHLQRRNQRYEAWRAANPFTAMFKVVASLVRARTDDPLALQMLPNWWCFRFPQDKTALAQIDLAAVAEWAATYTANLAAFPEELTSNGRAGLYTQQYWAEWTTASWLLVQNGKGLSVPSPFLWAKYQECWPRPLIQQPHYSFTRTFANPVHKPKWLRVFRRRWSIKWRRLPTMNPLSDTEISTKAWVGPIQPQNVH